MAMQKLEVGEISNKLFMLLVLNSIHESESLLKDGESEASYSNCQLSIQGIAENEIKVYIINNDEITNSVFEVSFAYNFNHICIDYKYYLEFKGYLGAEQEAELKKIISDGLVLQVDVFMSSLSGNIMKKLRNYENAVDCFPYMFNNVTCLNVNTGKIETIRLTPYYDILTPERSAIYGAAINRMEDHWIVYDEEKNRCLAKSFNRNGYGSIYDLSAVEIVESKPTGAKTMWIPIPAIEISAGLPLNVVFVLRDVENVDSNPDYLYMSTKGVFYNGEVTVATINQNDNYEILYVGDGKSLVIGRLESGKVRKVRVRCKSGETEIVKVYNIEATVERSEAINIESLQPFTSQLAVLSDAEIYDGTIFEPFNCHKEANGSSLGFELGKLIAFVRNYWVAIIIAIVVLCVLFV